MSRPRSEFKTLLDALEEGATVYGQAPGNTTLSYPAIIFVHDDETVMRADNLPYSITDAYEVTVIEKDPNTPVAKKVRELPMCAHNRSFVVDNLNHTVYIIYF